MAQPACPSTDFSSFVAVFADDIEVQRAFTATPLEWVTIDGEALPEPAPQTAMLDGDALQFPVMQNADTQSEEGLDSALRELGAEREWKLFVPDTGIQIRYLFRERADGSCWELYKVANDTF